MKKRKNNFIFIFASLCLIILIVKSNFDNVTSLLSIMLFIILLLMIRLVYINKKYEKLYKLAESSKRRYRMAIDALEGAIWEWNSENNKLYMSKKIKDILKINKDIESFDEWFSFIVEDEREDIKIFIENIIHNRILDNFILESSIVDFSGEKLLLKVQGNGKVRNNVFYLSGLIVDITERKRVENMNKVIENKNRLAVEGSKDIAFWWNVNQNIISIDYSIREYLEIKGEGDVLISDKSWKKFILEDDIDLYNKKINKVLNSKKDEFYSIDYRILSKDNKVVWLQSKGKKTLEKNGDLFIHGAFSDITDRKEKEIEINYLSFNDEVTRIPNRRFFVREVTNHINNYPNEKIAFIFIDLDNFKYVNDTYGHDAGDLLLIEFAKIIKNMKIKDSLFARYGGDEFIIVQYNIQEKNQIKYILDNIIKKLSNPIIINDKEIFCTLSIGVSVYPIDGGDMPILLKRADMAMYLAKVNGKNRYEFFDIKILEILNREFDIEKGLRVAVDKSEIKMLYQPKIKVDTEEVIGFESLVRWNSKSLGIVSPSEFIPIAESSGLIIPIGKYIINESFRRCKELTLKNNKKFKMAINLSEVQIRDEDIVSFISESLKFYDLSAEYIEFEITESIIMKSAEKNISTLEKLKKLGVSLALDDFGTGYSSLSYLRTLPIDVLKIDKSFIDGIVIEEKSEYIINSIVELSHYLSLLVVAEGVETKEQLDFLKRISCDVIQGYYFSRPVEFDEAIRMIST
ncbi:EAL domain-containing protein [Clostridium tertium]|uniref:EAL domain-containing protein n=1 Tax=Clostridium tertium TaxID=1559 RepID=A0A9X4B2P8_9CLOT|nr:GGDEF domain-containing phosphodiesterase [Clostridium tertium]MDB1954167.1 EAL domain-containing protein [Clostridium tertium]MDB1959331.1 EAL domain-containing protein [Clostridium tertium]MDB1961988.1 EAL domain-containing protein [Clostridium tertium]MDB1965087.1 EAL domain-containing protein [Clostridium tertium]MDC4240891.1 EAL domain-containing protein [Clostridium tertium]